MAARRTMTAARNEFGSRIAVSKRLPIPLSTPSGSATTSSTSRTILKSGAIFGLAAIAMVACGDPPRTSAIAGRAMTASPSQLGAKMMARFTDVVIVPEIAVRRSPCYGGLGTVKIALLQINPTVGDLQGNSRLIVEAVEKAARLGADLSVTPELALVGYLPRDLLLSEGFVRHSWEAVTALARELARLPPVLVGLPEPNPSEEGRPLYNAAVLLRAGRVEQRFRKALLPTYDVFDEDRYFEPFRGPQILELCGRRLGISICEDVWNDRDFWKRRRYHHDPIEELMRAGAEAIVNLSASPFSVGKYRLREDMLGSLARRHRVPVVYVNQFGGNDDLVFDGRSCAFTADGVPIARGRSFESDIVVCDVDHGQAMAPLVEEPAESEIWRALVLGTRDYARKCGFQSVVLGLSGGIDSALTAAIAAEAVGADRVLGALMPS